MSPGLDFEPRCVSALVGQQRLGEVVAHPAGRVLCHDVLEFGGPWLVIRRDGSRVG